MHSSESQSRGLCIRGCLCGCLREWELVAAREVYSKNATCKVLEEKAGNCHENGERFRREHQFTAGGDCSGADSHSRSLVVSDTCCATQRHIGFTLCASYCRSSFCAAVAS